MPVYWASTAGTITSAGSGLTSELAVCKLAMTWLGADPESISDVTSITSTSKKEETLCNIVYSTCRQSVLEDHNWQFAKKHQPLTLDLGTAESDYNATGAKTISGATAADPVVITAASHGFLNGWLVRLYDIVGMTQLNGMVVRVANKDANTFECYGLSGTKFTAYGSGGKAIRYEAITDYANGYVYRVPADMLRPVAVMGAPQFEVVGAGDDRRILCTVDDAVLEYIADISTVSSMPNHFARCWAARIAMELANPLQKKNASMKDMASWYMQVLRETKQSDGRNADPAHLVRNTSPTLKAGDWE
jgi:hypothetical protein